MPATITQFARAWIQKHITGTPEVDARFAAAQDYLEDYASAAGADWHDEEFVRRNNAAYAVFSELPRPRRIAMSGRWV